MSELDLRHIQIMQTHLRVLSQLIAWSNLEFASSAEALRALAEIVRVEIGYAQFGVGLVGADGLLRFAAGFGISESLQNSLTVAPGQGVVGWVLEHGAPLLVADVSQEPRYRGLVPKIRSELCVPLKTRALTIGVINVESPQVNAFGEHDVSLLTSLANGASAVLARIQRQENSAYISQEKFHCLSPREIQVLRELARGKRNVEIARGLNIKPHTVEHHVSAILKKLRLASRYEVVEWARHQRVLGVNREEP
ncbi:MAG: hypothetical protein B6D41_07775 [Chloroflexi bacterium UTCFX4]|jgi:DNA-binding CsgD family transcriptional regulator/putative methionine-R-sulfoxide reductase with GAF domain|nr:MAG: hypothetical protein B6D41_07775 [Chloroflexi bacterium UTCFX4]